MLSPQVAQAWQLPFPFLGQGRMGFALESCVAIASVKGDPLVAVHIVR